MLRRTRPVAAWVLGLLAMLVVTAPLAGADDCGPPAVLAVAAESGVAYALVSVSDWKTTGVYRSLDSGTTWERVDEIPATLHTSLYSRLHRRGRLVRCESVDTSSWPRSAQPARLAARLNCRPTGRTRCTARWDERR